MHSEQLDQWEDRKLVGRYLELRDEGAFRQLYRRHSPALYGLVLRLSGFDREEAEETVQETWVRACRKFASFRWESSLRTWLCSIAVMRLRERGRSRRRKPEVELSASEAPSVPPAARDADALDLERAIASLPERYRQVLILRDIQGYTHDEVGQLLDISPGTSKSQLFRARRAIRELMHTKEIEDAPEH